MVALLKTLDNFLNTSTMILIYLVVILSLIISIIYLSDNICLLFLLALIYYIYSCLDFTGFVPNQNLLDGEEVNNKHHLMNS